METQEFREAQHEDTPLLNPEIASLRAKLDRLQQEFARRPRIRRMTSVATRSSIDAEYLNRWTQKVELMGNQNFPKAALENQVFGSLRLSVIINSDGSVDKVEVLKPSGHPILDQAALQIIRLAGPFDPFPPEIRQTADQLDIIRTWRFEITGLKTGSGE
jgi:protein TonB